MTLRETFSRNVRRFRVTRKLSQELLATVSGLSVSYISMLERGERSPALETVEAVARALGVPPSVLLEAAPGAGITPARRRAP